MAGLERSDRQRRAAGEAFLQEAVFQSRARQAADTFLAQAASPGARQCGLGAEAAVVLDLSPRGEQLFAELWPAGCELESVRQLVREWIERQDALDRDRNHFLKAFRQRCGFDRHAYSPEQRADFEQGLERVNAAIAAELRSTAARLIA